MPVLVPLLTLAVFAQGTSEFMLAGLLPEISRDLGVPLATAGLLTSTFALGMVVGAPLTAAFSRRWPPRVALSGLLVLFMLMHALGALTDTIGVLLASRMVAALANAGFLAMALSLVARVVAAERQARALAVVLAGTTVALVAGVPAGAAIGAALSWRAALWAVALVCTPALLAVLVAAPRHAGGEAEPLRHELRILRDTRMIRTLTLVAVVNAATFCGYTYLAPMVTGPAALGQGAVPLILALFGVGAFLGVAIAGRFADRHARTLLHVTLPALVALWLTSAALAPSGWPLAVVVVLLGATAFAVGSTAITLAVRHGSAAPTMGGSFPTAALNVGAMVGPVIGGLAIDSTLGPLGPLLVSAAVAAAAWMLLSISQDLLPTVSSTLTGEPQGSRDRGRQGVARSE